MGCNGWRSATPGYSNYWLMVMMVVAAMVVMMPMVIAEVMVAAMVVMSMVVMVMMMMPMMTVAVVMMVMVMIVAHCRCLSSCRQAKVWLYRVFCQFPFRLKSPKNILTKGPTFFRWQPNWILSFTTLDYASSFLAFLVENGRFGILSSSGYSFKGLSTVWPFFQPKSCAILAASLNTRQRTKAPFCYPPSCCDKGCLI